MKSIIIHDWMLKHPQLKGLKLLIFATIYHFSSLGSGCFMSTASWLRLLDCSKSQFFKAKSDLINFGLISFDSRTQAYFCTHINLWTEVQVASTDDVITSFSCTCTQPDWVNDWECLINTLSKSDNETGKSDNETGKSDNETRSY